MKSYVPPPGMGFGSEAMEAGRLTREIANICRAHRVNAVIDRPPDAFSAAMLRQARIEALRQQQREALLERGKRGLARAREQVDLRRAARIERVRNVVMERGGPMAIN